MRSIISRRHILKFGLLATQALPIAAFVGRSFAADLTPLDPNDATAKALGFASDTTKVDAAANPTHKSEQRCGVCAQFQGKPSDKSGGCNIFAGHSVPAGGWCRVWVQKPAG